MVYLLREREGVDEVLLGWKRSGVGQGKIVAPGGKLEPAETPREAAVREVAEEVGISVDPAQLELIGELTYPFVTKPEWSQKSWAFRVHGDFGEPSPSAELDATWVPRGRIPLHRMWDDAKYWLEDALNGDCVVATFEFGVDETTVVYSDHPAFRGGDTQSR